MNKNQKLKDFVELLIIIVFFTLIVICGCRKKVVRKVIPKGRQTCYYVVEYLDNGEIDTLYSTTGHVMGDTLR